MSRSEEWNRILDSILTCAIERHKDTKEYMYLHQRQIVIDEMLTTNLSESQKTLLDECLNEIAQASERESEVLYQQGMKDCVWLLKNMGVLA